MDNGRNELSEELADALLHVLIASERAGGRRAAEQIARDRAIERIDRTAKRLITGRLAEPRKILLADLQARRKEEQE